MEQINFKIKEIAGRIRALRELEGLTVEDMAEKTKLSVEEYIACETGDRDLAFAFIYRCAMVLGVDVTALIEGSTPKLKSYTVTRAGGGQQVSQAHGMIFFRSSFRVAIDACVP